MDVPDRDRVVYTITMQSVSVMRGNGSVRDDWPPKYCAEHCPEHTPCRRLLCSDGGCSETILLMEAT